MAPASLSSGFPSFTPIPTIKLGPSGAGSPVGGLVHTLGPCGSLQRPLPRGWASLLLLPQPPWGLSIRGLRLYFPALEPEVCFAPRRSSRFIYARMWGHGVLPTALPAPFSTTLSPALSVYLHKCRVTGSASARTACPVCPTLRQSRSRHGNASPLLPGCSSPPLLPVWMYIFFLSTWCRTSLPFDFLSVLVVRGGAVCLPMPPSWFWNVTSLKQLTSVFPKDNV